jgi:hypothetical protein
MWKIDVKILKTHNACFAPAGQQWSAPTTTLQKSQVLNLTMKNKICHF